MQRNNEIGLDTVTHASCAEATDSTAAICSQVFAKGMASASRGKPGPHHC